MQEAIGEFPRGWLSPCEDNGCPEPIDESPPEPPLPLDELTEPTASGETEAL